jgi:hypothetical protein
MTNLKSLIFTLFLLFNLFVISSCKKDDITKEKGVLKVSTSMNYTSHSSGSYVYYADGTGTTVELSKNFSLISTQYFNNTGTFDLGEYEHGTYSMKVTIPIWSMNIYTGSKSKYSSRSETKKFQIKSSTTTVTFNF